MDSNYFGYSTVAAAGTAGLSYSPYSTLPNGVFGSTKITKFDLRDSPNSSLFSSYIDTQSTFNTYTDNLDQYSSTDNSSFDYNHYPHQTETSSFWPSSFLENANIDNHQIRNALQELESALMAGEEDDNQVYTINNEVPPNNLKTQLISCARALSENKFEEFDKLIRIACQAVSITGDPIQRLGAYMVEGLIARKESSGPNIYRSLKSCNEKLDRPNITELLSHMHTLYEICPYLKFGYMAANGAIAEACKNEDFIHIIDFGIAQGTQWTTLLQALAARPRGPPHVRITGVDDPVSKFARGAGLTLVAQQFAEISKKFKIPVEFRAVPVFALDVTKEMLDVRPNEALAVNFPLQLHHTPDESVDVMNPRDGLLRMVKSLNPKVVTLVEQESNTNTALFLPRFVETLDYYSAIFESIDVSMRRDGKERVDMEQHCLGRDVVNVIACEGKERVERHEMFGKWRLRFMMAGFRPFGLSSYVNGVIRGLLRCYSEHYTLVEKDGAMLLGWKDRNLISASAWC